MVRWGLIWQIGVSNFLLGSDMGGLIWKATFPILQRMREAQIHSRVVTSTFVFFVTQLSIKTRVVRAARTLRKAKTELILQISPRSRTMFYQHPSRILLQHIVLFPRLRIAINVSTLGTENFLTTPMSLFLSPTLLVSSPTNPTVTLLLPAQI